MSTHPRPWIDAWQDALYGDAGFYRRDEGPAGHFATSAQGIPGVDDILAQAVVAYAERIEARVVVDFACGRGELLESIARFAPSLALVGVDVVDRPARLDPSITWVRSPGGANRPSLDVIAGRRTLVLAHEWLDVVPCVIAQADDDGTLREVLVDFEGHESLGDTVRGPDLRWATTWWPSHLASATHDAASPDHPDINSPDARLRSTTRPETDRDANSERRRDMSRQVRQGGWAPGERVEIGRNRDDAWNALVADVARHAAPGSVVVGVDYGHTRASRPPLGTLTGFRDGIECPPTPDGSCDVTAHVVVDSLDVDHVATQREVLLDLFGEQPLAPVPHQLAHTDPPAYLQRLAVRSALGAAVSPDGLGAFHWFVRETH